MNDLKLVFFIPQGMLPWQQIFVGFIGFYRSVELGSRAIRQMAAYNAGEPINRPINNN